MAGEGRQLACMRAATLLLWRSAMRKRFSPGWTTVVTQPAGGPQAVAVAVAVGEAASSVGAAVAVGVVVAAGEALCVGEATAVGEAMVVAEATGGGLAPA